MVQPHPLEELEATAARLASFLHEQGTLPVLATAASADVHVAIDAWGILRGAGVDNPVLAAGDLTAALRTALDTCSRALLEPNFEASGWRLDRAYDPARPQPSFYERMSSREGDATFDEARFDAAVEGLRGEGRSGGYLVTTKPDGSINAITVVSATPDPTGRAIMVAARRAAADGIAQAGVLVDQGALDPNWAWTRLLLADPYDEGRP